MVSHSDLYPIQLALYEEMNKRFDGLAYTGIVSPPWFGVEFYAYDPEFVPREEVREFIKQFVEEELGEEYTVSINQPDKNTKYNFIVIIQKQ